MHITIIITIVIKQKIDISKRIENTKYIYIYLYFKSKVTPIKENLKQL